MRNVPPVARGRPKAPKDNATLRQGGIYSSRDKALKAVQAHALHHRFEFATVEVADAHVILQCKTAMYGQKPICPWECSYTRTVHGSFWMVTSLSPPESHVCKKYKREQGANAIANSVKVMKRLWGNLVRGAPFILAKILQKILTSHSKFQISYKQAWRLREEIQKEMYGDWQESFRLLPALADRFREIDPDGNFLIQTVDGCFNRMYIQPSTSRGALGFCRPVVALDGTFLISAQRATLLIAVVQDGNQKITMLAWALVEGENKDSWSWFLNKCFVELVCNEGNNNSMIYHVQLSFVENPKRAAASKFTTNVVELYAFRFMLCSPHKCYNSKRGWRSLSLC
ncbi:unnamed protein product [Closterium sp. NIES-53]